MAAVLRLPAGLALPLVEIKRHPGAGRIGRAHPAGLGLQRAQHEGRRCGVLGPVEPAGYILTLEDGKVLYHAGDTCLHCNMATWGALFDIDVALLPIGDHFTMDGRQAAHALRMLGAKVALPMHYRTFPLLAANADDFVRHAREQAPSTRVEVIDPGDEITF